MALFRFTSSLIRPSIFGQTAPVPPSLHTLVTFRSFSLSSNGFHPNGPPINDQNPVKIPNDSDLPQDPPPPKNVDQVVSPIEIMRFKQFVDNNPKVVDYFRNACETYALYKTGEAVEKEVSEIYDFGSRMIEDGFPFSFDAHHLPKSSYLSLQSLAHIRSTILPNDSDPPKVPSPPKNADQSSVVSTAEMLRFKQFVDNNPKLVIYFRNACASYALYKSGITVLKDASEIYDFGSRMIEDGFPLTFDALVKLFKGKSTLTVEEGVSILKAEMNQGFQSLRSEVSNLKTDVSNLRTDMGDMGQRIADGTYCWIKGKPGPVTTRNGNEKVMKGSENSHPNGNGKKNGTQNEKVMKGSENSHRNGNGNGNGKKNGTQNGETSPPPEDVDTPNWFDLVP